MQISNPLVTYSASPVDGTEDISYLKNYEAAVLRYMQDIARLQADEDFPEFPSNWKFLLAKWVKPNSSAANILARPDIPTPKRYCKTLIGRKTSKSEKFDDKLRTFLLEIHQPKSMDAHVKTIYEFLDVFWDSFMKERYLIILTEQFDENFQPFIDAGIAQGKVGTFNDCKGNLLKNTLSTLKEEFSIIMRRHFMMAMVAGDTSLFSLLENSQMPLTADPALFADWIQERICDANGSNIRLTLGKNESPLVRIKPSIGDGVQKFSNPSGALHTKKTPNPGGSGGPFPKVAKPNATATPGGGRGGPTTSGGRGGTPAPSTTSNATPKFKKPGNRWCQYCFDQWGTFSISHTLHDPPFCKRNPLGPKYDKTIIGNPTN
ncbi:MAG: hypothetical protein ACXWR0_19555 [Bdellovibrio sp.]